MKAGVGACSLGQRRRLPHFAARLADFGHLLVAPAQRRECRCFRLDDVAELLHGAQEPFAIGRCRVPAQHVAIEQVPSFLRLDPAADLGAGIEQALGHQHLDRLAHRRAADVEGFRPFRLVRQDRARRVVAANDPQADLAGQRGMHAGSGHPRGVGSPVAARPLGGSARRLSCLRRRFCLPVWHGSSNPLVVSAVRHPVCADGVRCDHDDDEAAHRCNLPDGRYFEKGQPAGSRRSALRAKSGTGRKGIRGRAIDERALAFRYFWMQVSTVSLVHSSSPVNTGSATALPSIRSIMTEGAL